MRGYKKISFKQFAGICLYRKHLGTTARGFICDDGGNFSGCECCASFCKRWRKLSALDTAEASATNRQQPQPKICPRCHGTKKVPGPFGGPATFTCVDCDTSVIRSGVR